MIDQTLKLPYEKNKLVDEILPAPLPGTPYTTNKYRYKISDIDLILRNKPVSLKNTYVIGAGLSDFHKTIVAEMKMHFPKMKSQVTSYRKCKVFHNETFIDSLRHELNMKNS